MERTREDLAWAAGLFEGEGSFYVRHPTHGSVAATIGMNDRDVLERFLEVVGIGSISTKPQGKLWRWGTWNFEGVQAVAALLWPWLHARRREKIKMVLSHCPRTARISSKASADEKRLRRNRRQNERVKRLRLTDPTFRDQEREWERRSRERHSSQTS